MKAVKFIKNIDWENWCEWIAIAFIIAILGIPIYVTVLYDDIGKLLKRNRVYKRRLKIREDLRVKHGKKTDEWDDDRWTYLIDVEINKQDQR